MIYYNIINGVVCLCVFAKRKNNDPARQDYLKRFIHVQKRCEKLAEAF